ncbi:hypothetical protein [Bdellovibrio sp. KM01]|uniref:hypothetical protein n=1 Tax=Bdellovibrio sp. KM01 TaxID=2748865 RepID=UPI0015E92A22|nr:hypothetical protein [Bdellovibrio sp. KM01]QLY25622.1 hypothetical protein HW988_00790 [Bdellovibrio sp. KM01]
MFKASLTYKRTISFLTALVVGFSSLSPALAASITKSEDQRATQDKAMLESIGYSVKVDYDNKITRVFDKKTNIPVMEIPFADEKVLRQYDPKNLERRLLKEMGGVWSANKAAFSHSLKNLAPESVMFFSAMGLVMMGELVVNYSQNPVAIDQHITHSFSPMGIIGFQLFMYSQGAASNVMAMYMKNPRYHVMIPYLGMVVGATVQGLASQLVADPNVKMCAKVWMGKKVTQQDLDKGVDKDPCSKAYEYLVIHRKLWEMAPNITSMLISSAVAATLEKGAVNLLTKQAVQGALIRWTGVDIVAWLIPGSMQVKGLRFLLTKGLKLATFVALDQLFMRAVTYTWRNVVDAHELYGYSNELEQEINAMKKSQWLATYEVPLQTKLKTFKDKMIAWRSANMASVQEASANWQSALFQLTQGYKSAENFYGDFVSQVRDHRYGDRPANITYKAPLFGVRAGDMKASDDAFHTDPMFVQHQQAYTMEDAAAAASLLLQSPQFKQLTADQQKKFTAIVNGLGEKDLTKAAQTLTMLNNELRVSAYTVNVYQNLLSQVRSMLGNPNPQMNTGAAWAATYVSSPATYEKVKDTNFYRRVGIFSTPQISDNLIMQMACGPDIEKGELAVRNSVGFPSVFLAPSIGIPGQKFDECSNMNMDRFKNSAPMPYAWPVKIAKANGKNITYNGWVEYLLAETRPSVIGSKDQVPFASWWKQNTYAQMKSAFDTYGLEYDKIVVNMMRDLYRPGKIAINTGPSYNGVMNAIFQEERVYLSILNDIMNPAKEYKMDFENNMDKAPTDALLKQVEAEFATMNRLIKQIKIVTINGRERIQSSLQNSQLEAQGEKINQSLTKVAETLGVAVPNSGKPAEADPFASLDEDSAPAKEEKHETKKFTLTKAQTNLVVSVLEALQGLSVEMKSYGSIANAVSWDKINNLEQMSKDQQRFDKAVEKATQNMTASAQGN